MSASDAASPQKTNRKKFDLAIIFAICGALFSLLIFLFMFKQERDAAIQQFQVEMTQGAASFQQSLTQNAYSLETLQAIYQLDQTVDQERLKQIIHSLFSRHTSLKGMAIENSDISLRLADPATDSIFARAEVNEALSDLSSEQVDTLTIDQETYALISALADDAQLTGVISLSSVLERSQLQQVLGEVQLTLMDSNKQEILTHDNSSLAVDAVLSSSIQLLDNQWTLDLTATEERIAAGMSFTPALFLMTGLLLSFLVASYLKRVGHHVKSLRTEQANLTEQMAETSWSDPLTGLVNKLHFDEALDVECRRAVREFSPLTMMLLKIDSFKEYSDEYGVEAAQGMLQEVSSVLKNSVGRPGDMIARIDDHLFAFILPSTNEMVIQLAERCCDTISGHGIPHQASPIDKVVTLSIGVATMQPSRLLTPEYLLELSKQQLQEAEDKGGNQFHAFVDGIKEPPLTYNV
ncbi:diguanylate cyclase domain-containing protein [Neptuniibacter sp. QD29_5]|uniref:diguanylate cyclase domain-containing protein n=1 Tax=Neptuniibacter sp. QD29_5 TaxID=3398207 RepID=UPI0039F49C8D